jgi:Kef-type K+ transport system membrane component KefB
VLAAGVPAFAAGGGSAAHADPFAAILLELALLVFGAILGRYAALRFAQPPVLGELVVGVAVGNAGVWLGQPFFVLVMHLGNVHAVLERVTAGGASLREAAAQVFAAADLAPGAVGDHIVSILAGPEAVPLVVLVTALWIFSNLGVTLLLFMVGLEATIGEMLGVGARALAVAIVGVVAPLLLGLGATELLLPGAPLSLALFLGATLSATSVGITARVLKDLGRTQSAEAKLILGAAVIDDVLGLVVLAVVSGVAVGGGVQVGAVVRICVLSLAFIGAVLAFGERLVETLVPVMAALDRAHLKSLFPLMLAFGLAWLAGLIGLATIVGAFAAGLMLNEKAFAAQSDGAHTVEEAVRPLEAVFAPIFFVLMGMQVQLSTFLSPATIGIALGLTVAAVAGKLLSGVVAGRGVDRLTIGMGMVPRGEVGLIFVSIGKAVGIIDEALFSAVVAMVLATTLLAPVLLKWSIARADAR